MLQRISNERIIREYQITDQTNLTPSAPLELDFTGMTGLQRVIVKSRGDNIVFNFGDSAVVASNTVTSSVLPDGNFSVEQTMVMSLDLDAATQNWVSVINESEAGATAIVQICKVQF